MSKFNILDSYRWLINQCNLPNVGYSQDYRNQVEKNGNIYYDCSSILWYALQAGDFPVIDAYNETVGRYYGNAFTTWQMPAVLSFLGFERRGLANQWLPGDIVIRTNHAEMVYSGGEGCGITMGAHTDEAPFSEQVSINNHVTYANEWHELFRYPERDPKDPGRMLFYIR